jgi:transaldolase
MRLFVDTADADALSRAQATGYVFGVTTNPTLLRAARLTRADLPALVQRAVGAGLQEIHLQVLADDLEGMLRDARALHALDPAHVVVKIPATATGFRAASIVAKEGLRLTITAVYAVRQVVLTETVGAQYAAVYFGRLRDAGQDATALLRGMLETVRAQRLTTQLLVASVRSADDVETLAQLGVPAVTLPPPILFALPEHAGTSQAVQAFHNDSVHL